MTGLRRALGLVAIEGIVVGLVALAIVLSSDHTDAKGLTSAIGLFLGWSWIGIGLYAWWRRPDNRFGVLMTAVGFAFFLSVLTAADASWLFTLGVVFSSLYAAVFVHMLLAYPDGRVESPRLRKVLAAGYALSIVGPLPTMLFATPDQLHCDDCPPSAIQVTENATLFTVFDGLTSAIAVVLVGYVLYVLVDRWRASTPAPAPRDGPGAVVRRGAARPARRPAHLDGRRRARRGRRPRLAARPRLLRARALRRSSSACCARACSRPGR